MPVAFSSEEKEGTWKFEKSIESSLDKAGRMGGLEEDDEDVVETDSAGGYRCLLAAEELSDAKGC